MVLTSKEKAIKREEVMARREANALALKLLPIACKQARIVSQSSGVDHETLMGAAIFGIAKAMEKREVGRPGFYSLAKINCRGYCLNYLRDHSRAVRLPRELTRAYLAEKKAIREIPGFIDLCDESRAAELGIDLYTLRESREAIAMHTVSLEGRDGAYVDDGAGPGETTSSAAQVVQDVLDAGIKAVAAAGKLSQSEVAEQFYRSFNHVLSLRNDE